MSETLSPEQKAARRAEVLKRYQDCKTAEERNALYWDTPELQEIFSAAMHPKPAKPATASPAANS